MNWFRLGLLAATLAILAACTSMGFRDLPAEKVDDQYLLPKSSFTEINGNNVHYLLEGKKDAPVLVLVHGFTASLHTWDGWVKELSEDYLILRFDVPGFGLTGPMPDAHDFSADYMCNIVEQLTKRLGITRFSIAGNSMGGYIAWNYAWRFPEKVEHLIVVDPMSYPQRLPAEIRAMSRPIGGAVARRVTTPGMVSSGIAGAYGDPENIQPGVEQRYFDLFMREGNRASAARIARKMARLADSDYLSLGISEISVPALVMWGEKDTITPFELIEHWRRDLPDATYVTYPELGHIPMEEDPVRTSEDLRAYLLGLNTAKGE
ncbi:MAG: alpha/beta fold hydrolase [Haliea sp.]|jgi:pimeloyl-ACP methyl ester carboxylesterase|nr:alpha/beta fold hydrolase [Haliea sp.]